MQQKKRKRTVVKGQLGSHQAHVALSLVLDVAYILGLKVGQGRSSEDKVAVLEGSVRVAFLVEPALHHDSLAKRCLGHDRRSEVLDDVAKKINKKSFKKQDKPNAFDFQYERTSIHSCISISDSAMR